MVPWESAVLGWRSTLISSSERNSKNIMITFISKAIQMSKFHAWEEHKKLRKRLVPVPAVLFSNQSVLKSIWSVDHFLRAFLESGEELCLSTEKAEDDRKASKKAIWGNQKTHKSLVQSPWCRKQFERERKFCNAISCMNIHEIFFFFFHFQYAKSFRINT